MIIQCDSGDVNANLIASARYCVLDEFEKSRDELRAPIHVVFIVQLPRGAAFTGFQVIIMYFIIFSNFFYVLPSIYVNIVKTQKSILVNLTLLS